MAKTIMISNEIYDELKRRKGDKSFTETIKSLINSYPKKAETLGELIKTCGGLLPENDTEYDDFLKESKMMWKRWREKLEKEIEEEESS